MQCTATKKSTGEQCKRRAVDGYKVCTVHGAGTKKRVEAGLRKRPGAPVKSGHYSRHFKEEVLEMIEDFRNDPDMDKVDLEVAYLKSLLPRIEKGDIDEEDKIRLLEKVLTSTIKNMETREKIIEARRYSIGVEKVEMLVKFVFASVQKHVDDPEVLAKIGNELKSIGRETGNIDGTNII